MQFEEESHYVKMTMSRRVKLSLPVVGGVDVEEPLAKVEESPAGVLKPDFPPGTHER